MRLFCLLLCLTYALASAQPYFEVKVNQKWGLIDTTGTLVLNPTFDYLYPAPDQSFFFTRKGNFTGIFHPTLGELVTSDRYESILLPEKGEWGVRVILNGKYGVISFRQPDQAIAPTYDHIEWLYEDYYAVRKGKSWGIRQLRKQISLPIEYQSIQTAKHQEQQRFLTIDQINQTTFWNLKGERIAGPFPYKIDKQIGQVFSFVADKWYGLLAFDGTVLAPARYQNFYLKGTTIWGKEPGGWQIFGLAGKPWLDSLAQTLHIDQAQYQWFKQQGRWGVFNAAGQLISAPKFWGASSFIGPLAIVRTDSGRAILNSLGEWLVPPRHRQEVRIYPGAAFTRIDTVINQIPYDSLGRKENRFILFVGNTQPKPTKVQTAQNPIEEEGYYLYPGWRQNKRGQWGLIDTANRRVLIPPRFDRVFSLTGTAVSVVQMFEYEGRGAERRHVGQKWGVVNHDIGKVVLPPNYDTLYYEDLRHGVVGRAQKRSTSTEGERPIYRFWVFDIRKPSQYFSTPAYKYVGKPVNGLFTGYSSERRVYPSMKDMLDEASFRQRVQGKPLTWAIINRKGKGITETPYSYLGTIHPTTNSVIAASKPRRFGKAQWGLIDCFGDTLTTTNLGADTVKVFPFDHMVDPGAASPLLITQRQAQSHTFFDDEGKIYFSINETDTSSRGNGPTTFMSLTSFQEGRLAIQVAKRKWGFVDEAGQWAIAPELLSVQDFHEGLAAAQHPEGKWGFVDPYGNWVIEPKYDGATLFSEGLAAVKLKKKGWGFIRPDGKWAVKPKFGTAMPFQAGRALVRRYRWGMISKNGKWIHKPIYTKIDLYDGYYQLRNHKALSSYVDNRDQVMVPFRYFSLGEVSNGRISYMENSLFGYLDTLGQPAIEPAYQRVLPFQEGFAGVRPRLGKYGFIDQTGEVMLDFQYQAVQSFNRGLAAVQKNKWGVINSSGTIVIPFEYDQILRNETGYFATLKADGQANNQRKGSWTFFDPKGNPITQETFVGELQFTGQGITIQKGRRQMLLDFRGIPIINPGFDRINASKNSDMLVGTDLYLHGLMDRYGKEIIPPIYGHIHFEQGYYRVEHAGKVGYLDSAGQWVWPLTD